MNREVHSIPDPASKLMRFSGAVSWNLVTAGLASALLLLGTTSGRGVPYASALSNVNGQVSFRLNEAADRVEVISGNGATTNVLGSLPAGTHSFPLAISGPFRVAAAHLAPAGFMTPVAPGQAGVLPTGGDTSLTRFNQPRGIAVQTDPAQPSFGRVYVANAAAGPVTNLSFGPARTLGDGLYLLNADLSDATGQGDEALTGGLDFTTGGSTSPYRLALSQDGNLCVTDLSDATGSVYLTDADVTAGSGRNMLGGPAGGLFPVTLTRVHGSIAAAVVEGSLSQGNLTAFVIDEDLQTDRASTTRTENNSLWRHDLGGALPGPTVVPTRLGNTPWIGFTPQTMDLSRGSNGYFYVNDYRGTGADRAGLYVLNAEGVLLWDSLSASRALLANPAATDLLRATGGGSVAPAGDWMALINLENNEITVLPLRQGVPDLTNRLVFQGFGSAGREGRDVAFDRAGNLYAISQGAQSLRVFSPGGRTTTLTGSDGTFTIHRPPALSVVTSTPLVAEAGPSPGVFTLTRSGDAAGDLQVSYQLTGTAGNGVDYLTNTLSATIPAGASTLDILITPINDNVAEPAETVTLTLLGSSEYDLPGPRSATLTLIDDDLPSVTISAVDSNAYERFPSDKLSFRVERVGQTNVELFVNYNTTAGTATAGLDFRGVDGTPLPETLRLAPGEVSRLVVIEPIDDDLTEGDETVGISLLPGPGYTVGLPGVALGVIVDNELTPGRLVFADDLDSESPANWEVRFGANNGIYDATIFWGFDYSAIGVPPAPNSAPGSTRGVFLQVNKGDPTPGGSAALNLYPAGLNLAGNYTLRCDLFMHYAEVAPTEHALIGINHSGEFTNRVTQSSDFANTTRGGDGVWVALENDGTANRECGAYSVTNQNSVPTLITNRSAAALAGILSSPPYAVAGAPGSTSSLFGTWVEVELSQLKNIITLKLNNSLVYTFTNTSPFKSGKFMIGLNDQFDSIGNSGSAGNFVIFDNVRVVNYPPTMSPIPDVGTLENTPVRVEFAVEDFETPHENLTVSVSSSNPLLLPGVNMEVSGTGSTRTLDLVPAPNRSGTALVTVQVTDDQGDSVINTFVLLVAPTPDPPVLSALENSAISEDASFGPIPFSLASLDFDPQSVTVTAASSNTRLLLDTDIIIGGNGSDRSVLLFPAPGQSGSSTVTLIATDPDGQLGMSSFVLTVNPVNDPPTLNPIPDLVLEENAPPQVMLLSGLGSGATNEIQPLIVTATSSNPSLLAKPIVTYLNPQTTGTLGIVVLSNATGTATVTVSVDDGQATNHSFSQSFTVTVNPAPNNPFLPPPPVAPASSNLPPSITLIPEQFTAEDTPLVVGFLVDDDNTPGDALRFSAHSSNQNLIPDNQIQFFGTNGNRALLITPALNQSGPVEIVLTVRDADDAVTNRSFLMFVNPINDPPVMSAVPSQTIDENTSTAALQITVGDVESAPADLALVWSSSNPTLLPSGAVQLSGTGAVRTMVITPAANKFGTAIVRLTTIDPSSGSVSRLFLLTVRETVMPPALTRQPRNATVTDGTTVTLTAMAVGAAPLSRQWQRNGVDLPGQTGQSLTLTPAHPEDSGQYTLVAYNDAGTATSVPATLTVVGGTVITDIRRTPPQTAVSFETVPGLKYTVEFMDVLDTPAWQSLPAVIGSGQILSVTNSPATNTSRFYRVRVE